MSETREEALERVIFALIDEAGAALEFKHGRDDLKAAIRAALRSRRHGWKAPLRPLGYLDGEGA